MVVANADDPMVAWAAFAAPEVRWVGAGQVWHDDAVGCPSCGGRIEFESDGAWACDRCDFARPRPATSGSRATTWCWPTASRHPLAIGLPGQFNRANAAMVAVAAAVRGWRPPGPEGPADGRWTTSWPSSRPSPRWRAGSRRSTRRQGRPVRLLLAKNPAGWTAIFDLLDEEDGAGRPVVLSVNARVADGLDTSWLWDVPFERLAGRPVVATGDRRLDLAVRLRYAEVAHEVVPDPIAAVDRALGRWRTRRSDGRVPRELHRVRRHPARPVTGRVARTLTVAVVYPDLLGTYGDGGNGLVLARRAAWRGIDVELVQALSDRPLPRPTSTTIGGGEDGPRCGRPPR